MNYAPVALFTYNRLQHTSRTISYLQQNELASGTPLIIFSDGPKNEEDARRVFEVREFLKSVKEFLSVELICREKNLGLAANIISGVTEVVSRYGSVIVVEDDLLTSPFFLRYMNDGLRFYEHDDKVVSIHGYVYPILQALPETFFIKGADCWGWATWRRGWAVFNPDGQALLNELKQRELAGAFDFNGTFPYMQMLEDQVAGRNNSWAIRWNAAAFLQDKLTLYPGNSLVQNIGHDDSGVHSAASTHFEVELYQQPVKVDNTIIEPSTEAFEAFAEYFRTINPKPVKKQGFFKRLVKKIFSNA